MWQRKAEQARMNESLGMISSILLNLELRESWL